MENCLGLSRSWAEMAMLLTSCTPSTCLVSVSKKARRFQYRCSAGGLREQM